MEQQSQFEEAASEHHFGTKYKRTLDSDEEDDEVDAEKYNILDTNEIVGTEKTTLEFDGDIKITPFNMDEELETGHFDKEGTYIFRKESDVHDNWLDNIDWSKVKGKDIKEAEDSSDSLDATNEGKIDVNDLYRQLLELVQPQESIQKAIQRYGKSIKRVKKGQKWKKTDIDSTKIDENEEVNKEKMMKLISIADQIQTETGDMEIYEKKYEDLNFHLKKINERSSSPANDMFSDDFDDVSTSATISSTSISNNEVCWEYKWENKDDAQIYGPFTSTQMLEWSNQGHFDAGIFVRKIGSKDAQFYTSKRIDFDLYV